MRILINIRAIFLILSWILIAGESASLLYALPQEELGKWWKNSEIVKELQLSEAQVNKIEQSFLNHRTKLVRLVNQLTDHEDRLNALMRAESLSDEDILAQADLVATARAELEKENASMLLSIRKVMTGRQWTRLGEVRDLRSTSSALVRTADAMAGSASSGENIYSTEDGIDPPKILYQPMPAYTQEARDAKAEGLVLLEVIIRKDGSVDSVKVLKGIGYGLDESAVRTISKEWRFSPGTLNARPVDVRANIEVSFRLY